MGFGQSEDNMEPDAVSGLALVDRDESLWLEWPAVETGTALDGARLSELNGVWYAVHEGSESWFDPMMEGERIAIID